MVRTVAFTDVVNTLQWGRVPTIIVLPGKIGDIYSNPTALGMSRRLATQRYAYADSCRIRKAREVLHIPCLAAGQGREPPLCQGLRAEGMENSNL